MATYTLEELTGRMHGKSVTLGWDAVVVMNRTKVNSLLEQQYITRFESTSFLKRIFGAPPMTPDGEEVLELSGVILSHPRLGFESASLRDSRVTATMDIVSGTSSYRVKSSNQVAGTVLYSSTITAQQGFTLTMDIDLKTASGTVSDTGKVMFDIGDGYNCRCNLVAEPKAQETLGNFFKDLFMEQKPEDRIYELGTLDLKDAGILAPKSFKIRTMATDEGRLLGSDSYGDGAVVLLVNTKGNPNEGNEPTGESLDYLIPNDIDPVTGKHKYSGALVLASRVLFDWYVQPDLEQQLGKGLKFDRESNSHDKARSLRASIGSIKIPDVLLDWSKDFNDYTIANLGPVGLNFSSVTRETALIVECESSGRAAIKMNNKQTQAFNLHGYNPLIIPPQPQHRDWPFNIYASPAVSIYLDCKVGDKNRVTLQKASDSTASCSVDLTEYYALGSERLHENFDTDFKKQLVEPLEALFGAFDVIDMSDISVLAISNLLFPEQNALQLTEARLPGDLLMIGNIDPTETTFTLDPLLPIIKAGESQAFAIRQVNFRAPDVTWTVRSIDGEQALGSVNQEGVYTAPDVSRLDGTAVRNVVTATYLDEVSQKKVTASALVTVAITGVAVTPAMSLIDMDNRKEVSLKAYALSGSSLTWTPRGDRGSLVCNGNEAVYTPPSGSAANGLETVLIDIVDNETQEAAVATVLLRSGAFSLGVFPNFHPGVRPNRQAAFSIPMENGGNPTIEWEVIAGEGSITEEGVFTAPPIITAPYSIVKGTLADVVSGYSIVHLSEHARQSEWLSYDVFDFEVTSIAPTVYANGLQQAKVVVRFKATDVNGVKVKLSQTEYDSICLVTAEQKVPLPEVGEAGVPEGGKWYYTEAKNTYETYPHQSLTSAGDVQAPEPIENEVKEFFVQCHNVENLRIAAKLTSDSYQEFYSNPDKNDGEVNNKVINLIAVKPPAGGSVGSVVFTFDNGDSYPTRVEGPGEYDDVLDTLDYYYLKLLIKSELVEIRKIVFEKNSSMVKWESDTTLEDIHSVVGYAFGDDKNDQGQMRLHVQDEVMRKLTDQSNLPKSIVISGKEPPVGQVLFSLQRRQYWQFDKYVKADFDTAIPLVVYDVYGNKHTLRITFDGVNRNRLSLLA